jgi:hypothetical protein
MLEGVSWTGGNSEAGTTLAGSNAGGRDAHGSLVATCIESRRHVVAKLLQRGRISLVAANDLLGRDCTRWVRVSEVLDAGLD